MATGIDPNLVRAAQSSKGSFEAIYAGMSRPNGSSFTQREIDDAYNFYRNLSSGGGSTSTTTSNIFSGGSKGSIIDSVSDAFVQGTGPLGKALVGINELVKGIADVGDKIIQSQMGVQDQNPASKIIFDMFKNGGINPMKLLTSGLSTAFNEVLSQIQQQSVLLSEVGSKTGLVTELGERLREDMIEASIEGARYGKTLQEIGEFYTNLVEQGGKFSLINKNIYDSAIPLSAALNMNLRDLSTILFDYEKVGVGLSQSIKNLEDATNRSLSLGVSARKVTETMKNDISKLNEYGFRNGVRGLEDMARKSVEFRMNMESVFKIADQVFEPEGALDLAANLQVLGGAFGAFNDPLQMMYMATNNVEGLQDALIGASQSLATYNDEQGRFEITGVNLRRAKAMAQELGIQYDELAKGAIAAAERSSAASALMSTGLIMSEEDREFLTNISRMEGGEMKIVVPDSLMDKLGNQTELTLDRLTDQQARVLLQNRESFKEMSTKDIAMEQLTEVQQMSRGIDVIAAYAKVRAAEFIENKASEYGGDMFNELRQNIESFSTRIRQEERRNTANTTETIGNPFVDRIRNTVSSTIDSMNNLGERMFDTNKTQQTSTSSVEGRVVHELQFKSQALTDSFSREMYRNPDMARDIISTAMPGERDYLYIEVK